ncbi:formate dehydrogenase accessory sulfurtransferase FdhD [Paenibacillus sp. UNC451MF]|uniref:formate dehydrogenase accessory sulfurtransferase FdhD n=1 Tax=Paenibacillus sp. UNC451MF TaxID=1449063 RepID=UPI00048AF741|nr:formate dehydrogenase accessory sulfurtransferase FdhD [Paenibacillus sp. UNC451MF]
MDKSVTAAWRIVKYEGGRLQEREDEVAAEYPLTIKVDGEEFATIVCSPSCLEDMVVGFLASEGMIRSMEQIRKLSLDPERGYADVELTAAQNTGKDWYNKRFIGSCCGKSRQFYFHNDARTAKTITSRMTITAEQCLALMRGLQQCSPDFRNTGGVHNAALASTEELLVIRSDIGRHNALDKIYGHCLQHRIPLKGKVLVFSGRVSSEVLLKTAKIGVGIVLSKSAPTQLALQLADDLGITVIGFIRGDSFNVYTHHERLVEISANR